MSDETNVLTQKANETSVVGDALNLLTYTVFRIS